MKSLKLSLFAFAGALLLSFNANAQTALQPTAKAKMAATEKNMKPSDITWTKDTHNFGEIEKGTPVSHEFTFKNTTKQTILITKVKASCGCTATKYTKTPIKPGEMGSVTATYNARKDGSFNKSITVITNDTDAKKILKIKGRVIAPEVEAPAAGSKQ